MTSLNKKLLATAGIVIVLLLLFLADRGRRAAVQKLDQVSKQTGAAGDTSPEGKAEAERVIGKVRKLYDLPSGPEPTVAAIVDVEKLRAQNSFYAKAQNGDYLVLTSNRAILYRESANVIVEVVPIQIAPKTK